MLKDALIIFKKELGNVFTDRRAIFANFLLPLVLMIVIFFVIGFAQKSQQQQNESKVFHIAIVNAPNQAFANSFTQKISDGGLKFALDAAPGSSDGLTITFDRNWDGVSSGTKTILAFDTSRQDIQFAAGKIKDAVGRINDELGAVKLAAVKLQSSDLKPIDIEEKSLAAVTAKEAPFAATLLPYLIIIMIFSGSLGLGMATTAGEKENGSLASLLVNQVSRSSIALGKVFAIMLMGLVNAIMNGLGVIIGTLLMAGGDNGDAANMSAAAASSASGPAVSGAMAAGQTAQDPGLLGIISQPSTIAILFLSLLMASAIASSVIVFLGTLAKNMKEASGYVMPVFIVVIAGGIFTMSMDFSKDPALFAIPLINVVFLLKAAILSTVGTLQLAIAVVVNVLVATGFVLLIAREFNSERVLYSA